MPRSYYLVMAIYAPALYVAALATTTPAADCTGAPVAIDCGQTISGALASTEEIDCYDFLGTANDVVAITTRNSQGFACWTLLGPDLQPVGETWCGQEVRTLPASGTYTMQVQGDAGGYAVSLEAVGGQFGGASNGPPEPTCAGTDGTLPVACGLSIDGALDPVADTDTYTFIGSPGQSVTIAAKDPLDPFNCVCWELFSPTGSVLPGGGTTPSEEGGCNHTITLTTAGVYTIKLFVGDFNFYCSNDLGAYHLDMTCPGSSTTSTTSSTTVGSSSTTTTLVILPPFVEGFQWPTEAARYINQDYAEYGDAVSNRYHTGLDIGGGGQAVFAAASGCATVYGDDSGMGSFNHCMGNVVVIRHSDDLYSLYAHLQSPDEVQPTAPAPQCPTDEIGVNGGDPIGTSGNTGSGFGGCVTFRSHLHFEAKSHAGLGDGVDQFGYTEESPDLAGYYDPMRLLQNRPGPSEVSEITLNELGAVAPGPALRMGPGYDRIVNRATQVGQRYVVLSEVSDDTGSCDAGWLQVGATVDSGSVAASITTEDGEKLMFIDDKDPDTDPDNDPDGHLPDAWVCRGHGNEVWFDETSETTSTVTVQVPKEFRPLVRILCEVLSIFDLKASFCEVSGFAVMGNDTALLATASSEGPEGVVEVTKTRRKKLKRRSGRRKLKLKLNKTGKRLLKERGELEVHVTVQVDDGSGATRYEHRRVLLKKKR